MEQDQVSHRSVGGQGAHGLDRLNVGQMAATAHNALLEKCWSWRIALHLFVIVALDREHVQIRERFEQFIADRTKICCMSDVGVFRIEAKCS